MTNQQATVTAWLDQWVKGLDAGVGDWPVAQVQGSDGQWRAEADWPTTGGPVGQLALGPAGGFGVGSPVGFTRYQELAVETTRRVRTPALPVLYLGIAAALVLAYVVPNASLLALPVLPRLVAAIALAFAPIILANLAFAKRFADTDDAPSAFGVNILGAMVGGCIEYLALIVGFRNLLIVAGLLYLVAFALLPRRKARVI